MTTRAQFVQKAMAASLSDDEIRQAMAKRRTDLGAFDDDPGAAPAPAAAAPAESASNGATGSWAPAPAAPAAKRIGLGELLMPATTQYAQEHGNDPSFGRYGSMAKDIISAPKRMLDANTAIASGNPDQVIEAATRTKSKGITDAIAREAPLMLIPGGQVRGVGIAQRIMSAAGIGGAEAAPSIALHQLERKADGQDFSATEAAKEAAAGGLVRGGFEAAGQAVKGAIPYLKRGISKLSEVSQDALESVTDRFTGKQNLAKASAAGKRFGNADGGTDLTPMAEELGQKVAAENASRTGAVEGARTAQRAEMEQGVLGLRNDRPVKRIQQVSAGDQGSKITDAIEAAKDPMQKAWKEGDAIALGDLRESPAAKATRRGEKGRMESVRTLVPKIAEVLSEHKALSPEQGVPKITRGAAGAIKSILGMAEAQGNTIDDLINLKGQLRSMQSGGKFQGEIFDATTDDRAFGQVAGAIDQAVEESIGKAVKDKGMASTIITAFRANQAKYASLKENLGDLSRKFGQVQNNENIVAKVKQMGPEKAVALIQEAGKNAPLKPVVEELRRGFVDDLLLSSVKSGEFSPVHFAEEWKGLSDDVKKAWLTPEQIKSVEKAVAKGTEEIADPQLVGKALFGKEGDKFQAATKLGNITSAAQKKALAELQSLDALFGTEFTQDAVSAYRAKQLQMGESGKLPAMGNIRTGKAAAAATSGGGVGLSIGASVGGPIGAGLGSIIGSGSGFFAQSPAGAVMMFRALNRLERAGVSDATKAAVSQGLRSATFQPKSKRF